MRIRLLTFDLDDTLWDVRPVLVRAEEEVAHWVAHNCAALAERFDRAALLALRLRLLAERPGLHHRISELRHEAMRIALAECGYAEAEAARLAQAAFAVFIEARHRVEPFAAVEATLAQLAARYPLGVITNGNADVFRLPLGRHFRFALRAETLGISKPDAAHFEAALREAGVQAGEALHIGDHHEHDIEGALRAGMRAVWFNPERREWPGGAARAEAEFSEFEDLPALVRRLDEAGSGNALVTG